MDIKKGTVKMMDVQVIEEEDQERHKIAAHESERFESLESVEPEGLR